MSKTGIRNILKTNLNLTHILNVPIIGDQESIFVTCKLRPIITDVNPKIKILEYLTLISISEIAFIFALKL